ncbi:uncharacterized protein LOC133337083, partial [Musca vetustissima]|uniref:uncharacterized protein LOC133337083 n=1 Tax=Musca vetustissima TaxID=27455 RepID=UPI002AB71D96
MGEAECAAAAFWRKYFQFINTEVDYNREYVSNYTLYIGKRNLTLNFDLLVKRNVTHQIWNMLRVDTKLNRDEEWHKIMGFDVNFCELLEQTKAPAFYLLNIWLNNVLKYGTLPRQCPVLEGLYTWRDFKLDKNSIPQFIARGYYRINVVMYQKRVGRREMLMNSTINVL